MNTPPTRAANGADFDPADPASCFMTDPGACLWYNVGCMNGCDECSLEGKVLYIEPSDITYSDGSVCTTPKEPTLPEYARSWNVGNLSTSGDWTKYNPWRSPGYAPVADSCGVASGCKDHTTRAFFAAAAAWTGPSHLDPSRPSPHISTPHIQTTARMATGTCRLATSMATKGRTSPV